MKEIKAYEATDGTQFFNKDEAEHHETVTLSTPVDTGYRPSIGETCEYWEDGYGWRECSVIGMAAGDEMYVLQSYECLWFEMDEIFRAVRVNGSNAIDEDEENEFQLILTFDDYENPLSKKVIDCSTIREAKQSLSDYKKRLPHCSVSGDLTIIGPLTKMIWR